ncbi:hypothetical protein [Yersinia pekkanenii]|nr:hypothetical protein [Yersinia pekkanenii]
MAAKLKTLITADTRLELSGDGADLSANVTGSGDLAINTGAADSV